MIFRIEEEMAVMPDHVHMFVSAPPDIAPSRIIQAVKSIAAIKIFERFPGMKRKLWGDTLWERGYFVMISGVETTDEMKRQTMNRICSAHEAPKLAWWVIH